MGGEGACEAECQVHVAIVAVGRVGCPKPRMKVSCNTCCIPHLGASVIIVCGLSRARYTVCIFWARCVYQSEGGDSPNGILQSPGAWWQAGLGMLAAFEFKLLPSKI